MRYIDRRKRLFIFVLFTMTLVVFATSSVKKINAIENNIDLISELNKTEHEAIIVESIGKDAQIDDSVIRCGSTMQIAGSYLYLIEDSFELEVYDISELDEPIKITTYSNLDIGYISKMIVQDNLIYIYDANWDFYILNCTNPLAITEIAKYSNLLGVRNFAINNWSLNIMTDRAYQIYDFENFTQPTLIGEFSNSSAIYRDFSISGNYTYLLDRSIGFSIIDTSNESDLIAVYNSTLGERHRFDCLYVNNTNLFIFDSTDDILHIYDITIPYTPNLITSSEIYVNVDSLFIVGSLLFLIVYDGFHIANISELPTIDSLSSYQSEYNIEFKTILFQNNHIILHNILISVLEERFPIHIVNIIDPNNPVHIYPSEKPKDIQKWLKPVIITAAVLVVIGPLVTILIIIVRIKKQDPPLPIDNP
ncbi:MAG: hypothetical protein ACTSSK_10495 [Candidatus Heimdallarchaeota archaeon]